MKIKVCKSCGAKLPVSAVECSCGNSSFYVRHSTGGKSNHIGGGSMKTNSNNSTVQTKTIGGGSMNWNEQLGEALAGENGYAILNGNVMLTAEQLGKLVLDNDAEWATKYEDAKFAESELERFVNNLNIEYRKTVRSLEVAESDKAELVSQLETAERKLTDVKFELGKANKATRRATHRATEAEAKARDANVEASRLAGRLNAKTIELNKANDSRVKAEAKASAVGSQVGEMSSLMAHLIKVCEAEGIDWMNYEF